MIDPITAIAVASKAFGMLKAGIAAGKELQDMAGTLGQWAGAVSDLTYLEGKAQNANWFQTLFGSASKQNAVEIFAAKKKAEAQRAELKQYLQFAYGQSGWEEFMRIEGQVRKQQQDLVYRKAEIKEKIIEIVLILFIIGMIVGAVGGFAYLWYTYK